MSFPLREPFFLSGRKSVLQRAVMISCVLGGLATLAAVCVASVDLLYHRVVSSSGGAELVAFWAAASLLIYGPLNYWNSRSFRSTVAAALVFLIALSLFVVWMAISPKTSESAQALSFAVGFVATIVISGYPLADDERLDRIAYFASLVVALPASVLAATLLAHGDEVFGATPVLIRRFMGVTVLSLCFFGPLAIPWGILFWWPPESDKPVVASGK